MNISPNQLRAIGVALVAFGSSMATIGVAAASIEEIYADEYHARHLELIQRMMTTNEYSSEDLEEVAVEVEKEVDEPLTDFQLLEAKAVEAYAHHVGLLDYKTQSDVVEESVVIGYISEADFYDAESEYELNQVEVVPDGDGYHFLLHGQVMDHKNLLGDDILPKVMNSPDSVVYVRNYRLGEDYEVIRIAP